MADPISTFAIDNAGPYTVTANSYCRRVEIRENIKSDSPPTADLQQYKPFNSSTPIYIPKGTSAIFARDVKWWPGDKVGAINTVAGSITVAQIESDEI